MSGILTDEHTVASLILVVFAVIGVVLGVISRRSPRVVVILAIAAVLMGAVSSGWRYRPAAASLPGRLSWLAECLVLYTTPFAGIVGVPLVAARFIADRMLGRPKR